MIFFPKQMVIYFNDNSGLIVNADEFAIFNEFYVFRSNGKNVSMVLRKDVVRILEV